MGVGWRGVDGSWIYKQLVGLCLSQQIAVKTVLVIYKRWKGLGSPAACPAPAAQVAEVLGICQEL